MAIASTPITMKSRALRILATGQLVGIILLPKCPACLAAYFGALASLGLIKQVNGQMLILITVVSLAFGLLSFVYFAYMSRKYGLLVLGAISTVIIITGKYLCENGVVLYCGIAAFFVASILNVTLIGTEKSNNDDELEQHFGLARRCCR